VTLLSFIYVPPQEPSPRARRLRTSISAVIEQFSRENPDTTPQDIRQALQLAAQAKGGGRPVVAVALAAAAALLLAGALVFFANGRHGGGPGGGPAGSPGAHPIAGQGMGDWIWAPAVAIVLVAGVLLMVKRRS
jgi:hypothetical protein